jgi:hypothetical protein
MFLGKIGRLGPLIVKPFYIYLLSAKGLHGGVMRFENRPEPSKPSLFIDLLPADRSQPHVAQTQSNRHLEVTGQISHQTKL